MRFRLTKCPVGMTFGKVATGIAVVSGFFILGFARSTASVLRTIASTCMGGAEGNTEPVIVSWPPFCRAGGMPQIMRGGEETGSST